MAQSGDADRRSARPARRRTAGSADAGRGAGNDRGRPEDSQAGRAGGADRARPGSTPSTGAGSGDGAGRGGSPSTGAGSGDDARRGGSSSGRTGGADARRGGARGTAGGRARSPRGGPGGSRVPNGYGRPGGDSASRRAEIDQRTYDPRREERRRLSRVHLPEDVEAGMLDADVRRELRSLAKDTADLVARHLVVVGRTIDDDPDVALRHARAARALAGRIGSVREAAGLAAYAAGQWAEALTELRAARRITGEAGHLAVLADCERALGRPERALDLGNDPSVVDLTQEERVELVVVLSGARRDLGQPEAAVLLLQEPASRTRRGRPWAPRLWYALADALLDAGRAEEARTWFAAAADADDSGQTDAGERLLELDGVVVEDLQGEQAELGPRAHRHEVEPHDVDPSAAPPSGDPRAVPPEGRPAPRAG